MSDLRAAIERLAEQLEEEARRSRNVTKHSVARRLRTLLAQSRGSGAPAEAARLPLGSCRKCGKQCRYVTGGARAIWVHVDTGHYLSNTPTPHDCNTYVVRLNEEF